MTNVAELRRALWVFVGKDRFHSYVSQSIHASRLRYWQEQQWHRFTAAHPEYSIKLEELMAALRICEVHGGPLEFDSVTVFDGIRDYARLDIEARVNVFPNAASDSMSIEDNALKAGHVGVWYCPACRQAKAEWEAKFGA